MTKSTKEEAIEKLKEVMETIGEFYDEDSFGDPVSTVSNIESKVAKAIQILEK